MISKNDEHNEYIRTYKISDGYVVSDQGTWVPGVYDSEETARLAGELTPVAVHEMWEGVLQTGRDLATIEDVKRAQ
jgi:hypothetical protein